MRSREGSKSKLPLRLHSIPEWHVWLAKIFPQESTLCSPWWGFWVSFKHLEAQWCSWAGLSKCKSSFTEAWLGLSVNICERCHEIVSYWVLKQGAHEEEEQFNAAVQSVCWISDEGSNRWASSKYILFVKMIETAGFFFGFFFAANWAPSFAKRSAFTVAAPSSLDNLVKDLKMNLTVGLWFTAGDLEGGRLSLLVDVGAGHGQGVCFFLLRGHSRWKNAWVWWRHPEINLRDFYIQKRLDFLLGC